MTQTAKLTASDGRAQDGFGASVSISGNTVAVGAYNATVVNNSGQGAAYVFTEPGSGWVDMTETAKLTASDGAAGDFFGLSISISGNTVVVGATQENTRSGAAYVFTEPVSGWMSMTQTAKLSDGATGDYFGGSVSVSGNTVVVGSWGTNGRRGAAYVFTEPASGWKGMTQTAELTASDGKAGDDFGESVSISGNTVVVGATQENDTGGAGPGAAYVFTEPASGWATMTQTAKLTASDGMPRDYFGLTVSISGNTVVVGRLDTAYVFAPTPLTVTPADWTSAGLTLTLGSDGNMHVYTTGTTTDALPPVAPASIPSIDITSPSDTSGNLTIDSTNGDPIPAGGLNYSGAGGLIVTGSGTVTLSGPNTYTGGTTVSAGTLLINAASPIPGGTSLTVDAGGTFIFDPSSTTASSVTSATTAAPAAANVVSSSTALSAAAVADVMTRSTPGHNSQSPIVQPAVLQPPQSVPAVALGTPTRRIAGNPAWLGQAGNSTDNLDQQRNKDVAILALETVFAEYGR